MAFCENCGAEIKEGETKCPFCGKKTGSVDDVYTVNPEDVVELSGESKDKSEKQAESAKTIDTMEKLMAAAAYWSWLIIIPLFFGRDKEFVKFHLNQGMNLLGLFLVLYILGRYISFISILMIAVFVFAIMGTINVAKGEMKEIPLIGGFRLFK
ncbi:MAG: hypothetical protein VB120_04530 [Lachnospiraceae bacterium]|nr:hypothetical protein [Lachnospiraceae bacterium]